MTSQALADELEVSTRTILRDVDAMTEAGLPIIVHQGNQGGIELGFNYRTRLTGLDADEAEALGLLLNFAQPYAEQLGLSKPAQRAAKKLVESMPDNVRQTISRAMDRYLVSAREPDDDSRLQAMALAVRERRVVYLRSKSVEPQRIQPVALSYDQHGWHVVDSVQRDQPISMTDWHDINVSSHTH